MTRHGGSRRQRGVATCARVSRSTDGRAAARARRRNAGALCRTAGGIVLIACVLAVAGNVCSQAIAQTAPTGGDRSAEQRRAAKALSEGQLAVAVQRYTEALADPKLTSARKAILLTDRGVVFARQGMHARAIADFNKAVTLFPEYAAIYNNRGAFLVSLDAIDEGIKDFNRALSLSPGYVAAWNNRAAAYIRARSYFQALADYTQAVRLAPGLAEPLTGRAEAYLLQDRPNAALRDLTHAIQNDARYAAAYRARAKAHLALRDFSEATKDLSRAIAFEPGVSRSYLLRGKAYHQNKELEAALSDFTKVVEQDPQSVEGHRERANIYILLDQFEEAERDLARAIELAPRDALAFAYRALMYKKRDQPELGMQEIRKAINIAPENAIVQWAKGETEEARSLSAEAADSFRKALAIDPNLVMAQLGLRRLGFEPPDDRMTFPKLGLKEWRVESRNGRYVAVNDALDDLVVPLEMAGPGKPQLLSWDKKDGEHKSIGLLTFSVGKVPVGSLRVSLQYVALINTRSGTLIAIEPDRMGDRASKWTWHDDRVTVAAIDGLTTTHQLKRSRPVASAKAPQQGTRTRRRRNTRTYDGTTPEWRPPWADQGPRTRRRSATRQRRRPKTLFDHIFGN